MFHQLNGDLDQVDLSKMRGNWLLFTMCACLPTSDSPAQYSFLDKRNPNSEEDASSGRNSPLFEEDIDTSYGNLPSLEELKERFDRKRLRTDIAGSMNSDSGSEQDSELQLEFLNDLNSFVEEKSNSGKEPEDGKLSSTDLSAFENADYDLSFFNTDIDCESPTISSLEGETLPESPEEKLDGSGNQQYTYTQSRNLATVKEVWWEYKNGINGYPSIETLNKRYGKAWRQSVSDQCFYNSRNVIYMYMENLISSGTPGDKAVVQLEDLRNANGWSLKQLQAYLTSQQVNIIQNPEYYQMNRTLTLVSQIWDEYTKGLDGKIGVRELELNFGSRWRKSPSDTSYYYRRKLIYNLIEKLIICGKSEQDAVLDLENFRSLNRWSLTKLQTQIQHIEIVRQTCQLKMKSREEIPVYQLSQSITTVHQLWQEYKAGINGGPSVEGLELNNGAKWRISETPIYNGRKLLYKTIKDLIATGKTEGEALSELEEYRLLKKMNLDELQKNIAGFRDSNADLLGAKKKIGFKQLRNINTVAEIWQEYTKGIDGNPSVLSIEKQYGTNWRQDDSDRMLFYRSRQVYDAVCKLMANKMTEAEAVSALEAAGYRKSWTVATSNEAIKSILESRKPS